MKESHRGIPTNTSKRHERVPITKINRFNQKTMSLPRIDDKKRWAGYPGITGISRKLALLVPECSMYVESFAGSCKTYQELLKIIPLKFNIAILNDKAKFTSEWLKREFPLAVVTNEDFSDTFQTYNTKRSFFMIDQPWFPGSYDQSYSCFNRKNIKEYDIEVLKYCEKLQGKFIITTRKENTRMLKSGFNNYLLQSEYVVCGRLPKVLLTTNLKLDLEVYTIERDDD